MSRWALNAIIYVLLKGRQREIYNDTGKKAMERWSRE